MRNYCNCLVAALCTCTFYLGVAGQEYPSAAELAKEHEYRIRLYHTAARELPPGVPNPLNSNGTESDGIRFTTRAYEQEAFKRLLQEANKAAIELGLREQLPVTLTNVVRAFICPFGYAYVNKSLGNITTRNYTYYVKAGNKFSSLSIANYDEHCFEYQDKKHQRPIRQVDTNGAYRLAAQWLTALQVDVKALERDCVIRVKPSEFWNRIRPGAKLEGKTFVPIYELGWTSPKAKSFGVVASMQIFTPTKTILQLDVYEPEYILRQPLIVTNLAFLLSQTNALVRTNAHATHWKSETLCASAAHGGYQ